MMTGVLLFQETSISIPRFPRMLDDLLARWGQTGQVLPDGAEPMNSMYLPEESTIKTMFPI